MVFEEAKVARALQAHLKKRALRAEEEEIRTEHAPLAVKTTTQLG